jgi:hypothetical protein
LLFDGQAPVPEPIKSGFDNPGLESHVSGRPIAIEFSGHTQRLKRRVDAARVDYHVFEDPNVISW